MSDGKTFSFMPGFGVPEAQLVAYDPAVDAQLEVRKWLDEAMDKVMEQMVAPPMVYPDGLTANTAVLRPGEITWVGPASLAPRKPKATFLDGAIGMDDAGMFAPREDRQYGFSPGQQAAEWKELARLAKIVTIPPA